jgi:hypothetical protein
MTRHTLYAQLSSFFRSTQMRYILHFELNVILLQLDSTGEALTSKGTIISGREHEKECCIIDVTVSRLHGC